MTDMVDELMECSKITESEVGKLTRGRYGLIRWDMDVTRDMAEIIKKAPGRYTTINCSRIFGSLRSVQNYVGKEIAKALSDYIGECKKDKVLVVGLGNGGMVADSLGVATGQRLLITGGMEDWLIGELGRLYYIEPKVKGVTGVASYDIVMGVVSAIDPDIVIAIDTLCARDVDRLCSSFQISDAGIMPGGGVGNFTQVLNSENLGKKVVAIGVPLIIRGRVLSACERIARRDFTIKEIDYYIDACANVIADGINRAVHGEKYKKYV